MKSLDSKLTLMDICVNILVLNLDLSTTDRTRLDLHSTKSCIETLGLISSKLYSHDCQQQNTHHV